MIDNIYNLFFSAFPDGFLPGLAAVFLCAFLVFTFSDEWL